MDHVDIFDSLYVYIYIEKLTLDYKYMIMYVCNYIHLDYK